MCHDDGWTTGPNYGLCRSSAACVDDSRASGKNLLVSYFGNPVYIRILGDIIY